MVPGSYCPTAVVFVPLEQRSPGKSRNLTKRGRAQRRDKFLPPEKPVGAIRK